MKRLTDEQAIERLRFLTETRNALDAEREQFYAKVKTIAKGYGETWAANYAIPDEIHAFGLYDIEEGPESLERVVNASMEPVISQARLLGVLSHDPHEAERFSEGFVEGVKVFWSRVKDKVSIA